MKKKISNKNKKAKKSTFSNDNLDNSRVAIESAKEKGSISTNEQSGDLKNGSNAKNKKNTKISTKKIVIVVVSAILVVSLIVTGVLIAIKKYKKVEGNDPTKYANLISAKFVYAIDINDKEGISIDKTWMKDINYKDFKKSFEGEAVFVLDGNLKLRIMEEGAVPKEGDSGTFIFEYSNKVFAIINVQIVKNARYISSFEDVRKIPNGSTDTCVQVADIDMTSKNISIVNFSGEYFGNHFKITNLDISQTGGLFKNLTNAKIHAVSIVGAKGVIDNSGIEESYGVLANKASYTDINSCVTTGSLTITNYQKENAVSVGGLVGDYISNERYRNTDFSNEILYSQTNVNIEIKGVGKIFVGGIIGRSFEGVMSEVISIGSITVRSSKGQELSGLYLGGMAGALVKEYPEIQHLNVLDLGRYLSSFSDIIVDIEGGGDGIMLNIGGLFGMLKNHSVQNARFKGTLFARVGYCNSKIGGFAGEVFNSTTMLMTIKTIRLSEKIEIESIGALFAGGLFGTMKDVQYDAILEITKPTLVASGNNNNQMVEEYVGKELQN